MSRDARRQISAFTEAAGLAGDALRAQPLRSTLAIFGIVIGIVTVILVASTLVGLRNSVALLFRELGTDNIFAYHLNGDPYTAPTEADVQRPQLVPENAAVIERLASSVRDVGVQLIVPAVTPTRVIDARLRIIAVIGMSSSSASQTSPEVRCSLGSASRGRP